MANFKLAASLMLLASANAFTLPTTGITVRSSSISSSSQLQMSNVVVISPPGGIGEVAAVKAAKMGSSVRWFVITPPSSTATVALSGSTMDSIAKDGKGTGSVELAGAQADSLLLPTDDSASALSAVSTWCGSNLDGIICVYDGVEESITAANNVPGAKPMDGGEVFKTRTAMMDAIRVAAKEASAGVVRDGVKVALLPFEKEKTGGEEEDSGLAFLGSLLGGNKVEIPSTLSAALGSNNLVTVRYGDLFGIPESSPEASAFLGGPRKYPVLRDEYTMMAVRIDPTVSVSGNTMMGESSRSSRLAVGEAAVRMATKSIPLSTASLDVCLTSLTGMEGPDEEDWVDDFKRAQQAATSPSAELFNAAFGSVPSIDRLADWMATKWAPAVLKTYDIAGIRVGARPVYASRVGDGKIEIVWQELKDFKTNFVGTMIIEVTESGITAVRGGGDASAGYGSVSRSPLNGEDILVRRLSDAAVQAIEKGLATKPAPTKRKKKVQKVTPVVVSTVVSAGAVETPAAASAKAESGPRTTGARRSSERARGKRRTRKAPEDDGGFQ